MTTTDIINRLKISTLYTALAGVEPKRTGPHRWRGAAPWRGGKNLNVAGDDSIGAWYDHQERIGGGLVDLVTRVRGGTRQEALAYIADLAGIPLENRQLSPADRAEWVRKKSEAARIAQDAGDFASVAILFSEWTLEELATADPYRPAFTALIRRLKAAPEAEYLIWKQEDPRLAAAIVHAGGQRRQRLGRMVLAYVLREGSDAQPA